MVEIINVSKIYKTRKRNKTQALRRVNLKFPSKGMVFIVGKSGCGKSTLLNIIGAIEKQSEGAVLVSGRDISQFSSKEKDCFRGRDIGFVFQDYNLLPELTVKQNLETAGKIADKEISDCDIKRVLEEVGLTEYSNHYPSEMSGGQQQRVATARALLKKPKIVLADEPTGNLDSQTSAEMFKLLKKLSQDKLVIIVSHDKDSAKVYADRVIELEDGSVISDNDNQEIDKSSEEKLKTYEKKQTVGLRFRHISRASICSFKKNPIMLTIAIMLCAIAIGCGALAQSFGDFEVFEKLPNSMQNNDISLFNIFKPDINFSIDASDNFTYNEINSAISKNSNNAVYREIYNTSSIIINGKDDIFALGFSFIGDSKELDDESVYITDILIWHFLSIMQDRYYVQKDGVFSEIKETEQFFGDIYKRESENSYLYTVSGIVKTGFQKKRLNNNENKTLADAKNNYLISTFRTYFCNEKYLRVSSVEDYKSRVNIGESIVDYQSTKVKNDFNYEKLSETRGLNSSILIYNDGSMWWDNIRHSDITLDEKECVISLALYNQLFGTNYRSSDFCDPLNYVKIPLTMPTLGQKISINILGDNNKSIIYDDLEVVGVVFIPSFNGIYTSLNDIYLPDSCVDSFAAYFELKTISLIGFAKDYDQLSQYMETNTDIAIMSVYAIEFYMYQSDLIFMRNILYIISIVLLAISIFLLYHYINSLIAKGKKSIGIYRSLGATRANIINIYLLGGFVIAMLIALIATVGTLYILPTFNSKIAESVLEGAVIISGSPTMIAVLTLTSFVTILLAVLFPTIKLGRMKPIDVIRKV